MAAERAVWRRPGAWLAGIVLLHLLAGGLLIFSRPLWQAHEADFYTVARFLATQGRLPTSDDYPPGRADAAQATQPPLWFYLAAPVISLLDRAPVQPLAAQHPPALCIGAEAFNSPLLYTVQSPEYQFPPSGAPLAATALRFLGLFTLTGAVLLTYAAGRALAPQQPSLALIAAAVLALEPGTLLAAVTISNDMLIVLLSALAFFSLISLFTTGAWRWAGLAVLAAALAMLARLPGWAVLAVTLAGLAFWLGRVLLAGIRARRGVLLPVLGALGVIALIGGLLLLNIARSGTLLGRYAGFEDILGEMTGRVALDGRVIGAVLRASAEDYLAGLPLTERFRSLQGPAVFVPLLLILAGIAYGLLAGRRAGRLAGAACLLAFSLAVTLVLVLGRNAINIQASGGFSDFNGTAIFAPLRYYTPALPAAALLIGMGWLGIAALLRLLTRRGDGLVGGLAFAGGLALAGFFAWNAVSEALTQIQQQPRTEVTTLEAVALLSSAVPANAADAYPDGLPRIVNYRAMPGPEPGLIDLTLWLSVETQPLVNAALVVRLADQTCAFIPARGYETPLSWRPGEVRAVRAMIPNCASPLDADAPLSAAYRAAAPDSSTLYETEPLSLNAVGAPLPVYRACPQTLGVFAETFRLVKFNSPPEIGRGENYQPSLNWIIEQANLNIAGRIFRFTHDETGTEYTCSQGDIAMSAWVTGEYRYFDRCVFTFPDDAPVGPYTVSVQVLAQSGDVAPTTDAAGQPVPDGWVDVGRVTVR